MAAKGINVIFGGAGINEGRTFGNPEVLKRALDILEQGKVTTIDTAALYGQSEEILSKVGAPQRFTIDTKAKGGFNASNGGASREKILSESKRSRELLGPVDVYYIHAPDKNVSLEETLAAINEVHQTGFFKRFALSNFLAEDVQKVYDICKEKGYVLPSVYQGNYSAVARRQEELLFPTLRKLGMSFYAYSPLAGGFLTKSKKDLEQGVGRFQEGSLYGQLYGKPALLESLKEWAEIAEEEGCTQADMAYRWVRYNSPLTPERGDGIIVGASKLEQLEQTLAAINGGPLSEKATRRIDELWLKIKDEAPLDNFNKDSA